MTQVSLIICPFCGHHSNIEKATLKAIHNVDELAWISIRDCRGKKGMPQVGTTTLRATLDENIKLANQLTDLCSGILTICMDENLFTTIRPPSLVLNYYRLLKQSKNHDVDDSWRLKVDDLNRQILKLIEIVKTERAEKETIGLDLDDANQKLIKQQQTIHAYEDASLSI